MTDKNVVQATATLLYIHTKSSSSRMLSIDVMKEQERVCVWSRWKCWVGEEEGVAKKEGDKSDNKQLTYFNPSCGVSKW